MVFTDTIKYFSKVKIPVVNFDIDKEFDMLSTLHQDNQIKFWKILDIYKWEFTLRKNIEEKSLYSNSSIDYAPICILPNSSITYGINLLKFSSQKHKFFLFEEKSFISDSIVGKSLTDPTKKIKVTMISKKSVKKELQDACYILACGSDQGTVDFLIQNKDGIKHTWILLNSVTVSQNSTIIDLAWNKDDSLISICTFNLEVIVFMTHISENNIKLERYYVYNSLPTPARQLLWSPYEESVFSILTRESLLIVDSKTKSELLTFENKFLSQKALIPSAKKKIINSNKKSKEKSSEDKYVENSNKNDNDINSEDSDRDMSDLIDEELFDYIHNINDQGSWSKNSNVVTGLFYKEKSEEKSRHKDVLDITISKNFSLLLTFEKKLHFFKISPKLYKKNEKSQEKYEVCLVLNDNTIKAYSFSDSGKKIKLLLTIGNIKKFFTQIAWLDSYRILCLDELGRFHMFTFNPDELGISCS